MSEHRTDRVFGVSRDVPMNYIARAHADTAFIDNLTREKHIVLHGSSKQGKTSLRKMCLTPDDYIVVQCDSNWDLGELHGAILKEAGFEVTQSNTKTISGKNKANIKVKAGFSFPLVSVGTEDDTEREESTERSVESRPLELDLYDVNDVIRALESIRFTRYIILEDFHYLQTETKKRFAVALKAYHERSKLCFIVVGVWLEHDRLAVYNGDLVGRILSVSVDEWSSDDLHRVISKGEELLNVRLDPGLASEIVERSLQSVYIVQEACHQACIATGVYKTHMGREPKQVNTSESGASLVKRVVDQEAPRFTTFLNRFAGGFKDTELQMFRWLLYPILSGSIDDLEGGLRWNEIRKKIEAKHPSGSALNAGNLTIALQSISSLQVKMDVTPIILDYDQTTKRLSVVDRSFLIWLAHQDRNELLEEFELPRIDDESVPALRPAQIALPNV